MSELLNPAATAGTLHLNLVLSTLNLVLSLYETLPNSLVRLLLRWPSPHLKMQWPSIRRPIWHTRSSSAKKTVGSLSDTSKISATCSISVSHGGKGIQTKTWFSCVYFQGIAIAIHFPAMCVVERIDITLAIRTPSTPRLGRTDYFTFQSTSNESLANYTLPTSP